MDAMDDMDVVSHMGARRMSRRRPHRRTAAERRGQRMRAQGRAALGLLRSAGELSRHRGGQPSSFGAAIVCAPAPGPTPRGFAAPEENTRTNQSLADAIATFGPPRPGHIAATDAPTMIPPILDPASSVKSEAASLEARLRLGWSISSSGGIFGNGSRARCGLGNFGSFFPFGGGSIGSISERQYNGIPVHVLQSVLVSILQVCGRCAHAERSGGHCSASCR
eukprot:TRINITY_DN20707_c0_g1_i1.p1 TRINITY_DN20707_c0_g1~~TRINITY_DN20707_c0_g1_i1.p1  ORF type:complete len:240 (-),score=15.41 TRINITY_DN20707_c0_g1_i1:151-816(-)